MIDTKTLGASRRAVLDAALTHLKPGPASERAVAKSSLTAVTVLALWLAVAAALGAWKTVERDV